MTDMAPPTRRRCTRLPLTESRTWALLACAACFGLGSMFGATSLHSRPAQAAANGPALPFNMQARVGANIYLQTSAEYRACCLQIYKVAAERLEALVAAPHSDP